MKGNWTRGMVVLVAVAVVACSAPAPPVGPAHAPPADQPSSEAEEPHTSGQGGKGVPGDTARSSKPRDVAPDVPPHDVVDLVADNADFAFTLYQSMAEGDGNLFFSPHSISVAIAMTYAGARTSTEDAMARAMRFGLPQDRLHPAFNGLDLLLSSRGEAAEGTDGDGFRLNTVNAIWGQAGFGFLDPYLDVLGTQYGAGLRLLDFAGDPEGSRRTINGWVADATEDRIQDLIPAGAIDALTRLVLTNAIYFNAAWAYPFNPENTVDGEFHLLDGSLVTVPIMAQSEQLPFASGDGYQAVELPYDGQELSMVVILPDLGEFRAVESALTAEMLESMLSTLHMRKVDLAMPRFQFESEFRLNDALSGLGMGEAFGGGADFSGMTGAKDLAISDVVHKAFVSVDEAGTEAAAATAVMMRLTAEQPETPVELRLDRPFMFAIRDNQTGAVLFVGRVMDPSA